MVSLIYLMHLRKCRIEIPFYADYFQNVNQNDLLREAFEKTQKIHFLEFHFTPFPLLPKQALRKFL